jgi:hypothetical protein
VVDLPDFAAEAAPERVVIAVAENTAATAAMPMSHGEHDGDHPDAVSVRSATHNGHDIVIRTRYEIEVDGQPFAPRINVDNSGRVQYHGLPTRDFASMVDLVKKAIDTFPDDFPDHPTEPSIHPHHDHPDTPHGVDGHQ